MTDKELLELAAKAAGFELLNWTVMFDGQEAAFVFNDGCAETWNPLNDDGDALRLIVKLKLCIDRDFDRIDVYDNKGINETEYLYELPTPTDPYAATRRAIVRAAAEIGKSL